MVRQSRAAKSPYDANGTTSAPLVTGAPNILANAASLAMPPSMFAPVVAVNLPAALEFTDACARSPTTSLRLAAAYVPA